MIDFRYHLVSLISVFLALAVGIALGAGPLKESIGDTLTGQVDQLRAEKEDLRAEADQLSSDLKDSEAAITALSPSVMADVLGGRRVALVVLDEVDPAVTSSVSAAIGQAGGSVTAVATVTSAWTDPTRTAFRQSLAGTMVSYLDQVPAADAGADVELADALIEGLTVAAPTNPDTLSDNAGVLLDLLSGDAGLVSLANPVTTPADAVLVLAGPITPTDGAMADGRADRDAHARPPRARARRPAPRRARRPPRWTRPRGRRSWTPGRRWPPRRSSGRRVRSW